MENIAPFRIQSISILVSLGFLLYITRLIVKGKLRVEYSIVWIVTAAIFILFSFWRSGLEKLAHWLGVYAGINLAFAGMLFAIFIYLLHLSIGASRLAGQNKALAQELALLKEKLNRPKAG